MQPLSAHHRIERTEEGARAWRETAMEPSERRVLGALRKPALVGELLRSGAWPPSELETLVNRMGRLGWVQVHQPSLTDEPPVSSGEIIEPAAAEPADDLRHLLARHREDVVAQEAAQAIPPDDTTQPESPGEAYHPAPSTATPAVRAKPAPSLPVRADPLPFDRDRAEDDGLMEALRNPSAATHSSEHVTEWAPPSGGLAALLRALGEPVPPGVELSPDQREHMHDLEPVQPWGGTPSAPAPEIPRHDFVRLKDHAEEESGTPGPAARPKLDALRGSLGKVQQERAEANAVRDRAKAIRDQREQEAKKIQEQRAAQRKIEDKRQENTTFMGLSQKLAKVKDKGRGE